MPSPKRWHPVSREINNDAELWVLEDRFGSHVLRLWLEILARLDENDNRLRIDPAWIRVIARRVGMSPRSVVGSLLWMIVKFGWLTVVRDYGPPYGEIGEIEMVDGYEEMLHSFEQASPNRARGFSNVSSIIDRLFQNDSSIKEESKENDSSFKELSKKNHSPLILSAVKWAKYHKTRDAKSATVAPLPTGPDKEEESASRPPPPTLLNIIAAWNGIAGLKEFQGPPTQPVIQAFQKVHAAHAHHNPQFWTSLMTKVSECSFLQGEGPNGWKASLSWLLEPGNLAKVLAGDYDD